VNFKPQSTRPNAKILNRLALLNIFRMLFRTPP